MSLPGSASTPRRRRPRWRRRLLTAAVVLLLVAALAAGGGLYLWRRALPQVSGTLTVQGPGAPVEIVRDRWGVPHIFADSEADGWFGLGFAVAQDRLFQLEFLRHAAQGRLAELFGERALEADRLIRTLDFPGHGRRLLAAARPEVRAMAEAYTRGLNAALARRRGRLPPEFVLLRRSPEPFAPEDFAGLLGLMTWNLGLDWLMDPLVERLVARVGPARAAELFPYADGGRPAVFPAAGVPAPDAFPLAAETRALLAAVPSLAASNAMVVAPDKSASGAALLANDTHLPLRLPPTWYTAHVQAGGVNVAGVTMPGVPYVLIGHNRRIAWGFTNLMLDSADFFRERLHPEDPGRVMVRGRWVPVRTREEVIRVKGGEPVRLTVRTTPHGPLVSRLKGREEALSYRWTLAVAGEGGANEFDAFHDLQRAGDWAGFRAALSRFGVLAQNVAYADRAGHIGVQAAGRIPLRRGPPGHRLRPGWDGSAEWRGFVPFADNPRVLDPPAGWAAAANNPLLPPGRGPYISAYWEPVDRVRRIRALLRERLRDGGRVSADDLARIQADVRWPAAADLARRTVAAFRAQPPPAGALCEALGLLRGWDGAMTRDSAAATVFAVLYKHLFYEVFADEMGRDLAEGFRERGNVSAVMLRAVLEGGLAHWLDRAGTAAVEDEGDVLRAALAAAVGELRRRLGGEPAGWRWGRLHTLMLTHPLGRVRWLAPLFNLGPLPMPGHANTVFKMQFADADYRIGHGPTMRLVTDFADLATASAVLPGGQSGVPASPHYDDLLPLWRAGRAHPLPLSRAAAERSAEARLVLRPGAP